MNEFICYHCGSWVDLATASVMDNYPFRDKEIFYLDTNVVCPTCDNHNNVIMRIDKMDAVEVKGW